MCVCGLCTTSGFLIQRSIKCRSKQRQEQQNYSLACLLVLHWLQKGSLGCKWGSNHQERYSAVASQLLLEVSHTQKGQLTSPLSCCTNKVKSLTLRSQSCFLSFSLIIIFYVVVLQLSGSIAIFHLGHGKTEFS